MPSSELLQGGWVRLTALSETDVPAMACWDADGRSQRLHDTRSARPRSEAEIAEHRKALRDDDCRLAFCIQRLDADTLIGTVELDGILWPHRVCGLGIIIGDRENWGRGYGYEAVCLGLAFAFQELNFHRVTATIFSYNQGSIALFEKLGFQRDGVFRESLERDGERHDMLLYSLLRHEWTTRFSGVILAGFGVAAWVSLL